MAVKLHECEHDGARLGWLAPHVYVCPQCRELYWIFVGRGTRPTDKHAVHSPAALALLERVRYLQDVLNAAYEREQKLYREREQRRSA